jgi:alpha-mannosidase
MNNPAYIERMFVKYERVIKPYSKLILRTVGRIATAAALETREHLRRPPQAAAMAAAEPGTEWGSEYGSMWLRTEYTVPAEAGGEILCVIPEVDAAEILCFRDGKPAGIINSKNNFIGGEHPAFFVTFSAEAGRTYDLAFECYAGHKCLGTQPYDRYGEDESLEDSFRHVYRGIRVCVMDREMRDFVFDLATVVQLARLPEGNYAAKRAYECLKDAFPFLIADPASAGAEEIRESCLEVRRRLAPALEKSAGEASRGKVYVVGHSHMDTAWLWPVSETVRKCARTYSQALSLMDEYPDYTFIQSSALHLDWMRRYYPDIFEGIRARVAEGRYEPNGGVWVECDCNITGGEAMVRQFLYGQRFTQEHLGYRSDSFWLPDTFGYNGAIPQIMLGSGVRYFFTTKMSWSDCNRFPADVFVWRGIDGSEVITHLNRMEVIPDVRSITECAAEIRDKRTADSRLAAYGFGDGGGGPTYGMLEFLKRTKDLPGLPEVRPSTVSAFMQDLDKERDRLPVWDGELYLEFHRGTLTQMHTVKKTNRRTEAALYAMELAWVLSGQPDDPERGELWKVLLKNQFHDILPGTCIPRVYEVYREEMGEALGRIRALTDRYLSSMSAEDGGTSLFNPLPFAAETVVTLPGERSFANAASQTYVDRSGETVTAVRVAVPAMSAAGLDEVAGGTGGTGDRPARRAGGAEGGVNDSCFKRDGDTLVTPYYIAVFDENGYLKSLRDRSNGRLISNPKGAPLGTLWLGEDMPKAWDNWEIEDDVVGKQRPVETGGFRVVGDGAVEYRIRSEFGLGRHSKAVLDTVFYAADRRIDYELTVDWHERHQLLKAGFDVNIRSAFMKNEIQFGHVDRPTTRNTVFETAKFEVCNHRWTDLSETNYGVAVLNDCKYGISCEGSDLRLTLHKGGCRPDPFTDNGVHTMRYALLPHAGPFCAESVVRPAYVFNCPPIAVKGRPEVPKLFEVSAGNIIAEAVKNAEDVPGAYVIRLYEAERSTTDCTLRLFGAKRAWITNMLEEKQSELPLTDGAAELSFRPFEIKTVLVERE